MKCFVIIISSLFLGLTSCAQKKPDASAIFIGQSANGGDWSSETLISCNNHNLEKGINNLKLSRTLSRKCLIDTSSFHQLYTFIANKCNMQNTRNEYTSDFVLIKFIFEKDIQACYVVDKDAIRMYFKSLITETRKLPNKSDRDKLVAEFEKILNVVN